eukprot:357001-Chlamydomonas_euryale.AAC.3
MGVTYPGGYTPVLASTAAWIDVRAGPASSCAARDWGSPLPGVHSSASSIKRHTSSHGSSSRPRAYCHHHTRSIGWRKCVCAASPSRCDTHRGQSCQRELQEGANRRADVIKLLESD